MGLAPSPARVEQVPPVPALRRWAERAALRLRPEPRVEVRVLALALAPVLPPVRVLAPVRVPQRKMPQQQARRTPAEVPREHLPPAAAVRPPRPPTKPVPRMRTTTPGGRPST